MPKPTVCTDGQGPEGFPLVLTAMECHGHQARDRAAAVVWAWI